MLNTSLSKKRKTFENTLKLFMYISTALTAALVLFLLYYVLVQGLPNVTWELLSTKPSYITERIGILPDILNTIYLVIATLLIVAIRCRSSYLSDRICYKQKSSRYDRICCGNFIRNSIYHIWSCRYASVFQ